MTQGSPGKKENFFVRLVRASVILSALDRFTARVYDLLKNGLFGWIFTGDVNVIGLIFAVAILAGMLYMLFVKKYHEATTLTTSDAKKIEAVGRK